ncbi:protein RRP6-like 1 isoform X4 [Brassica napus]|uniref:protein RRP6-like 1 isoform X4 n=1 Tax=Brassica napus TaxID=3708 RepID=UPI002079109E|nr:protein RRP6-like 1 isoform X4 [Brassica napus]
MAADDSPGLKSLEALIGGSLPENLSKLSSTCLAIPANKDFHFLCNFDEFKLRIDEISGSSQCVLETIGGFCRKPMRYSGDVVGDDAYDWLVNLNDEVLQRIDLDLEDTMKKETDSKHGKAKVSFHIATIKKPQEEYKILVNNANVPFEHVWLEKKENNLGFIHPLEKLSVMDFVDKDISEMKPVEPLSLEGIPFKLVEEINDLKDLAAKLSSVDEFAVDLEHNQYRSFQGLTCLMQISTRTEDYIVDTFKLWDHVGTYLRDIFKDPKKKKVMHGADRDIIWLQRDFGIYVCNLFDTGQASRVLKLERKSLEFLLKHYCGVAANKQYQNADWRIRPLPDVMTRYAREDTHYLLYIYDVMRVDLHTVAKEDEKPDSPLVEVYKRSYDVCMQLYEKELLTENSYLHIYGVQAANFNAVQLAIVAGLCEWQDRIARADDESTGYVLPNKTLLEIAKEMPINVGKLRRLFKSKLPYIERNVDAVISVIRRSMQNAAAFEPVVQSLKTWHPGTVENDIGGVRTTVSHGSGKVSVDVSEEQSGGFGALPSKRKFGNENKANEEVKVSKSKPACVSKPDEVIILSDDNDEYGEETSEPEDAADSVSETPFKGPDVSINVKTFGPDIIVLDDDDSDDDDSDNDSEAGDGREREVERMNKISEQQGKFMSLKPGFLNI